MSERGPKTRSECVYEALLVAYPKQFRREYGSLMTQLFGDLCRKEHARGGSVGLVRLWLMTLSDLAVSTIAERSKVMGSALVRVGGFATLKNLMLLNGWLLLAFGIVFANAAPVHVYGLAEVPIDWQDPTEYATIAMGRLLGVVCVGFGALLLATARVAEMFARQAASGALFVTYLLGSLSLSGVQMAMWESTVGWITVAAHLFFAAGYGLLWFKGTLAPAPLDIKPMATADREF